MPLVLLPSVVTSTLLRSLLLLTAVAPLQLLRLLVPRSQALLPARPPPLTSPPLPQVLVAMPALLQLLLPWGSKPTQDRNPLLLATRVLALLLRPLQPLAAMPVLLKSPLLLLVLRVPMLTTPLRYLLL